MYIFFIYCLLLVLPIMFGAVMLGNQYIGAATHEVNRVRPVWKALNEDFCLF